MKNFIQKLKYLFNANYVVVPVDPEISNKQVEIKEKTGKKEKVIVGVLLVIFLTISIAVFWDLSGKNMFLSSQKATINTDTQITITPAADVTTTKSQKSGKNKQTNSPANKADRNVSYSSYSTCIENTKDLPSSKDCCDCLSADIATRKACRDFAATYDFTKNTAFKTFEIPSKLGQNGDYSKFTASGNQQQCKQACESTSSGLVCGDYRYCRTACDKLSQ